ncbi:heme ABC transporter ATP-binding protein CcmA [Rodentibacter trehalosifermentans]|uniref:Heme ABC transporter ATP-binding protein CcmA n=2 Tax=Rodentibacter TaxID=1960084 RepID=A0A1V3IQU1_9PAST|nr:MULTISPECIES: cytochrome c biogenesis heme-transporting ATPase CcmA [Rodentibacter]OOF41322.1 heme ABC transporter ATP-binding protein CcmA [Rodentibacter rarus]OOF44597.1 heme ABC transporter ATP-binding protein CcmA [Rodentibacter rarus]OOF46803.1 heme ABC transporter ATP-binding protein CcmA [Rodentibacter trehalosifermentans]
MFDAHTLSIKNLACRRGERVLFRALSQEFKSGDFVQVEGHNGIGKTSLLRILAGLAQPLEGEVYWDGEPITKQREMYHQHLLYLGHLSGVKPELTAWENLQFYQRISQATTGEEALWAVLEKVGLVGREDLPAAQLSAGQQRRIALARLWLSRSALWILDEPFTAIDKKGVDILTALFDEHTQQGGIVLLTSHQDVPSYHLKKLNLANYKAE